MNEKFMKKALAQAKKAMEIDEVPVGVVIVKGDTIISSAYNKKEKNNDPLGHAEIIAIKKACKKLNTWRLSDCSIYVTLEPCTMCLSALINARIKNIYFGAIDKKSGACGGLYNLLDQSGFNHYPSCDNLECEECSKILKDYFKSKRKSN